MWVTYDVIVYLDGDIMSELHQLELWKAKTGEDEEKVLFIRLELRPTKGGLVHKKVS